MASAAASTEAQIADIIVEHCYSSASVGLTFRCHPLECLTLFAVRILSIDDRAYATERSNAVIQHARRSPGMDPPADLAVWPLLQSLFRNEAPAGMPRPNWHNIAVRVAARITPSPSVNAAAAATASAVPVASAEPDASGGSLLHSVLARRGARVRPPPRPQPAHARRRQRIAAANAEPADAADADVEPLTDSDVGDAAEPPAAALDTATMEELRPIIKHQSDTIRELRTKCKNHSNITRQEKSGSVLKCRKSKTTRPQLLHHRNTRPSYPSPRECDQDTTGLAIRLGCDCRSSAAIAWR